MIKPRKTAAKKTSSSAQTAFNPYVSPLSYGYDPNVAGTVAKYTQAPATPAQQLAQANQAAGRYPAWTPQQTAGYVSQVGKRYAAPLDEATIMSRAQSTIDPVIAKISEAIQQRAANQQRSVQGYTNSLVNNLTARAPSFGDPYTQAATGATTANDALANQLASGGQQTAGDLQARLQAINTPAAAADPAVAAAQAATGGGALAATGNLSVDELLKNRASALSYGQKLPGIAALGGIQQAGLVGQQAVSDIASQTAAAEGQLPTIVSALRAANEQRLGDRTAGMNTAAQLGLQQQLATGTNRAQAFSSALGDARTLADTQRGRQASFAGNLLTQNQRAQELGAAAAEKQLVNLPNGGVGMFDPTTQQFTTLQQSGPDTFTYGGDGIAQVGPDGTLRTLKEPTPAPPADIPTYGYGQFVIDPKTGQAVQITKDRPTAASAGGGVSTTMTKAATALVGQLSRPVPAKTQRNADGEIVNVPGSGRPKPMSYADTLAQVIALGPDTPAWHKKATQIVQANPAYKMGHNGRPFEGRQAQINAEDLVRQGMVRRDTAEAIFQHGMNSGLLPEAALHAALKKLYRDIDQPGQTGHFGTPAPGGVWPPR